MNIATNFLQYYFLSMADQRQALIPVIVLETIAANLGSMLTPLGNPQNLYLYTISGLSLWDFIRIMLPYSAVSALLLILFLLVLPKVSFQAGNFSAVQTESSACSTDKPASSRSHRNPRILFAAYCILFLICLLTVLHILPFQIMLLIVFFGFLIAPRVEVQAPAGLKARILKTAAQAENTPATARTTAPARPRQLWLRPLSATLSAAALIALVLLVFDPVGRYRAHAAGRIFRDAAAQLDKSRSFRLEMNVRTLPQENFSYIDAEVPFVPHRMWVEPGSGRWRLEKAGRIALSDGERILMWSPEINSGFIMRPGSGAIEDFATLLDPYTLLLREELNFAERRNASYSKQVGPETITLTVEAPAEGDFSNDYLSGTSIDESDTRREYRFDRTTGRLIGLKIEQTDGKTPVTIAELQRIVYDIPLSDTLFRAYDGIEWIDLTKPVGGVHFAAIAPEEAARTLFAAMQTWDTEILAEGLVFYPLDLMKERYAGCRLLETQPAFRSGQYAGVFVPCRVKMSDGRIEKIVLALRNDNPTGSWVADGGL